LQNHPVRRTALRKLPLSPLPAFGGTCQMVVSFVVGWPPEQGPIIINDGACVAANRVVTSAAENPRTVAIGSHLLCSNPIVIAGVVFRANRFLIRYVTYRPGPSIIFDCAWRSPRWRSRRSGSRTGYAALRCSANSRPLDGPAVDWLSGIGFFCLFMREIAHKTGFGELLDLPLIYQICTSAGSLGTEASKYGRVNHGAWR